MDELPTHMEAQLLEAFNTPYKLAQCPLPKLTSPHELLIRVEAAGYCHTDAVLVAGHRRGGKDPASFPHIGGHEFAGTVVALHESPSESANLYSIGSRVGLAGRGFGSCGVCFECRRDENEISGYSYFCVNTGSNGLSKNGGFAQYAVVDARQCVQIPENTSAVEAAPLMCAGITIFNAIKQCNLKAGQRLGIIGCGGGLGHLGLQFATAMGHRVTGIDAADGPLQLARSLGTSAQSFDARAVTADEVLNQIGTEEHKHEEGDVGLDAVIILPESQRSFDYGMKLLRNHATCVVVSIPVTPFQVNAHDLVFRGITVKGSILGTNATQQETVEFAAKHGVKAVTKTFPLAKLNELAALAHDGFGGKLVVDMTSG